MKRVKIKIGNHEFLLWLFQFVRSACSASHPFFGAGRWYSSWVWCLQGFCRATSSNVEFPNLSPRSLKILWPGKRSTTASIDDVLVARDVSPSITNSLSFTYIERPAFLVAASELDGHDKFVRVCSIYHTAAALHLSGTVHSCR